MGSLGTLTYLVELVEWAPGITVPGAWLGPKLIWTWYLALAFLLLFVPGMGHRVGHSSFLGKLFRPRAVVIQGMPQTGGAPLAVITMLIVLAVPGAFIWTQILGGPDGRLHLYFFDVGQGDSALIVTPTEKQVLVDGGPEWESATTALTGPLPAGDRSLDLVVLTHLDADHSRGLLKVLDRYQVASVLVGQEDPDRAMYPQWQASMERSATPRILVADGYRVLLEPEVVLEVLNPPFDFAQGERSRAEPNPGSRVSDQNNDSVVLRLVHGEVSFLLAADIEMPTEARLIIDPSSVRSSALKVAHHGSRTSTISSFLDAVDPAVAVVSVGADNRFGHPAREVIDRLGQGVGFDAVYRTDRDGTIELISDGKSLWVKTER